MPEEPIKKRLRRAKIAAEKILNNPEGVAKIIFLDNHVFQIEAIRDKEIRKIRIVFDRFDEKDEILVRNYKLPQNCTKEIWCRHKNGQFELKTIIP